MNERNLMMIGIAETGKTTFLAALFHIVESGQIESSLQLVELGATREYLVRIRDKWLGCNEMERTKIGDEQLVELKLLDIDTKRTAQLVLPDISGETCRDQWEKRKSTKIFDELARRSQGILFFVHPNTIKEPVRINRNRLVADILKDEATDTDGDINNKQTAVSPAATQRSENSEQTEWHPRFAPTQTQLVEILQFLLREPDTYPISHIAVIVSAWDLFKNDNQYHTPSDWLVRRVPLLHQFLTANSDRVGFKAFGISAQGGKLGEDDSEMLSKFRQAERIEVVTDIENEFNRHDITAPLKWLLENSY